MLRACLNSLQHLFKVSRFEVAINGIYPNQEGATTDPLRFQGHQIVAPPSSRFNQESGAFKPMPQVTVLLLCMSIKIRFSL